MTLSPPFDHDLRHIFTHKRSLIRLKPFGRLFNLSAPAPRQSNNIALTVQYSDPPPRRSALIRADRIHRIDGMCFNDPLLSFHPFSSYKSCLKYYPFTRISDLRPFPFQRAFVIFETRFGYGRTIWRAQHNAFTVPVKAVTSSISPPFFGSSV